MHARRVAAASQKPRRTTCVQGRSSKSRMFVLRSRGHGDTDPCALPTERPLLAPVTQAVQTPSSVRAIRSHHRHRPIVATVVTASWSAADPAHAGDAVVARNRRSDGLETVVSATGGSSVSEAAGDPTGAPRFANAAEAPTSGPIHAPVTSSRGFRGQRKVHHARWVSRASRAIDRSRPVEANEVRQRSGFFSRSAHGGGPQ